ncbi:hypothetical protein EIP86_007979 [Pleurotus ostreatoroseus]|nr:hypothetical protein EIP86_007979 [Pleurotus ostreatoroseus]
MPEATKALRGTDAIKQWKQKILQIGQAVCPIFTISLVVINVNEQLPEVPFYLFAATAKDAYRKPLPGMWRELERIFTEKDVFIGKNGSKPRPATPKAD